MILEAVIGALVPVGVEAIKRLIDRFVGGVVPTTVDEAIRLSEVDLKRLEAIAALDDPHGTPSQWVIDLRASSRYIAALIVITTGVSSFFIAGVPPNVLVIAAEAISTVFGFLFGSRLLNGSFKR